MAGIAALAAAYILSQFYRSFLAVLAPVLTAELGATKADLSAASGVWFALFAIMQFAVGISLDRYGPRRTASILLGVCAGGGAFLFAIASVPSMVIAAMALIGVGCSPVLMASMFIFAKSFSPARLAMLTSWLVGVGTLGNVFGASPLAAAAEALGWRGVMAGLGALTILVAAIIFVLVRDPETDGPSSGSGFGGYLELLQVRLLWPILPLISISYAATASIRGLWAGPYLADVYGADVLLIGEVTFFMALAMAAGSFIYGPLNTLLGTLKWLVVAGNGVTLAAIVWIAFFPSAGIGGATVAFVAIGLFGVSFSLMMAHGAAFMPAHLTGRGVTLLNFFSIGGTGVMQFATGGVVTAAIGFGGPVMAYRWLFVFYAGLLAAGLAVYLLSRDARPGMTAPAQLRPAKH